MSGRGLDETNICWALNLSDLAYLQIPSVATFTNKTERVKLANLKAYSVIGQGASGIVCEVEDTLS
jgi:hypothetical protein